MSQLTNEKALSIFLKFWEAQGADVSIMRNTPDHRVVKLTGHRGFTRDIELTEAIADGRMIAALLDRMPNQHPIIKHRAPVPART